MLRLVGIIAATGFAMNAYAGGVEEVGYGYQQETVAECQVKVITKGHYSYKGKKAVKTIAVPLEVKKKRGKTALTASFTTSLTPSFGFDLIQKNGSRAAKIRSVRRKDGVVVARWNNASKGNLFITKSGTKVGIRCTVGEAYMEETPEEPEHYGSKADKYNNGCYDCRKSQPRYKHERRAYKQKRRVYRERGNYASAPKRRYKRRRHRQRRHYQQRGYGYSRGHGYSRSSRKWVREGRKKIRIINVPAWRHQDNGSVEWRRIKRSKNYWRSSGY